MTEPLSGEQPPTSKRRNAALPFIMLTVLIDMAAIGLIIPVLPALVGSFTGSQEEQAFWYGGVLFSFGIANFFGSPILGALSDRYGRRPVLLLGFCGLALNFFATAVAPELWMLLVVRLFGGAMQANAAVANAYVADITPPEQRARRFGALGAMIGLGFIIGPVMGGLLGDVSLRLPFYVAGGLALLNLLYGYFVLPESLPVERRRPFAWRAAHPLNAYRQLAQLSGIGQLLAVIVCCGLAQFMMHTSWVLYTTFKFGWGPQQNGWSLATVGVVSVIVQGVLLGRLLKRLSSRRLAVLGLLSSAIAHLLWGLANEGWMMYAIIAGNALGFTVTACIQSIISSAAGAARQGETMGAVNSINSLMAVIAPVIAAPLLGMVSHLPKGDWRIGAPMYFCAALLAAALVLAQAHFRRERQRAQ
ncbi:MAG: Tetracycline-efflux transporter [Burkholderiaceae bacterium]|nr:Tetracycline-efflux transporter [Burkholderiaceae bacterium]